VSAALATSHGVRIVAYGSYGSVRGYGRLCATREAAERNVRADSHACAKQGGYSDRNVIAVDAAGLCWSICGDQLGTWVRSAGGSRGAYYTDDEMAALGLEVSS
jgi:hypothetical protein